MFEPETVDLSELPSFPLSWKKALPKTSEIYFAIDSEDVVYYIGMSKNINNRWISHHRYEQLLEMEDIKLAWLEVSDIKLLPHVEKALIQYFEPKLNKTNTKKEYVKRKPCGLKNTGRTHFKSEGIGIKNNQRPVSVKLPEELDKLVKSLPNRSEFIREAIAEKAIREGLIEDLKSA